MLNSNPSASTIPDPNRKLSSLPENVHVETIQCRICKTGIVIRVNNEDAIRYHAGMYIQDAFPYLSAADRELILSRVCGTCFDKMFEEDDDPQGDQIEDDDDGG